MPSRNHGLGWAHAKARAALPPPDGTPCPFCRRPMLDGQRLDADHSNPRVLGGAGSELRWSHAGCNRREGARLGNLLRGRNGARWVDRWS